MLQRDSLCEAGLREKLIPTFDQDIVETNKEAGRNAWASSSKHLFSPCFEEEFPGWALSKAMERCDPNFPISEDIIDQARIGVRSERTFYEAVQRLGGQWHQGFRMPSKPDLTHALRDTLIRFHCVTPNVRRWADRIIALGSKNKQLDIPSEEVSVNWDVASHLNLTGVLMCIGLSDRQLWFIDFDSKRWKRINSPEGNSKPKIRPMWSPDGKSIAFSGKQDNGTVTAVLTTGDDPHEYIIDLGDPRRPTSLSDWDPCEGDSRHLFVNGPDHKLGGRYRLWRTYYDGHKAIDRVEPLVGYVSLRKHRKRCIAIGSGGDIVRVLRFREPCSIEVLKELNVERVGALAWNYASSELQFAFVQDLDGQPDTVSTIQLAELDTRKLDIRRCTPLFPPIRFIQDLCWSPDGKSLLLTGRHTASGGDSIWLFVADLRECGRIYPLLNQWVRISGRSWYKHVPEFLALYP